MILFKKSWLYNFELIFILVNIKTKRYILFTGGINLRTLYNIEKDKIAQKRQKKRRERDLDKIYKIDQNLEKYLARQQEQEVTSIYGENAGDLSSTPMQLKDSNKLKIEAESENVITNTENSSELSLHSKLKNAKIDISRYIEPEMGVGALHEFIPATKLKGIEDWVFESEHYQYYQSISFYYTIFL